MDGRSDSWWFLAAIATPIVQQVAVVIFWRSQLCHQAVTRLFGDAGFILWGLTFFPLLAARPLLALAVGLADPATLPIPPQFAVPLGVLLMVPVLWTGHSVPKHFGMARALAGDHLVLYGAAGWGGLVWGAQEMG